MGCRHALEAAPQKEVADKMADGLQQPTPPAPSDPRLPLTALQVFKLKKSWKGIKRCMESTGVEMFLRLFKSNKELKQLFQHFRHIDNEDDLRTSEELEAHASKVMDAIDEAISNIDNVDATLESLKRTGKTHARIQGFIPEHFWSIEQPFLDAVRISLGDRYTDNMDVIYKIVIKFILNNLIRGVKSALS